jgi:hypothetical protein
MLIPNWIIVLIPIARVFGDSKLGEFRQAGILPNAVNISGSRIDLAPLTTSSRVPSTANTKKLFLSQIGHRYYTKGSG